MLFANIGLSAVACFRRVCYASGMDIRYLKKRGFQARLRLEAFLLCYKKERRPHACMMALAAPSRKRKKKYDVLVRLADSYD